MQFSYIALDKSGDQSKGIVEASTSYEAREMVRAQGLKLINMRQRQAKSGRSLTHIPQFTTRVKKSVQSGLQDVSTLLGASVPLNEALNVASRQSKNVRATDIFSNLADQVANGDSLDSAMEASSWNFDPMCIALVRSGQESGAIEISLNQYLEITDRWSRLRSKVLGALIYPVMVLACGVGVVVFLSTFVLPAITDIIEDTGGELPWMTRAVIGLSQLVHQWWWLGVVCILLLGFSWRVLRKNTKVQRTVSWFFLRFPLIGEMTKNQHIAHTCALLSGLLKSGMQLVEALRLTAGATSNILMQEDLDHAVEAIEDGEDPGDALQGNVLPEVIAHVFVVAQSPQRVEELLDRLSVDFDRRLDQSLQRFVTMFEPIMILLLASVVGFIALSVLLPIMEAGNVS